jgi:hypothetical protein
MKLSTLKGLAGATAMAVVLAAASQASATTVDFATGGRARCRWPADLFAFRCGNWLPERSRRFGNAKLQRSGRQWQP